MNLTELLNSDMTTLTRAAQQGFDWWLRELRGLVPARLGGASRPLAAFHRLGPADEIVAARTAKRNADTLVLPEDICLVRQIALPAMREADLRALVELDADRILPVAASALVVGVRPGGPSAQHADQIDVTVGALPLVRAERIARNLAEADLAPRWIGPLDATGEHLAFDLAPAMRAAGLLPQRPPVARFWWIVVGVLIAINLIFAVVRDQQQVNAAQAMVDAQAPALGAVRRIEATIGRNTARINTLRTRRERQQPLRALARLGVAIPARSWVQRMEWDGVRLRVSGYAARDVNPIAAIKASGAFVGVRAGRADALTETAAGRPFDFSATLEEKH
ncbi:MAG: hypothetical protein ACKVOL_15235 [Novosphingobium sp.]